MSAAAKRQGRNQKRAAVRCFLSHSCRESGDAHHEFGRLAAAIFADRGLELLIDPFGAGVDVGARIQTIEFHALLFLFCRETWASRWCREELATARDRSIPVFVVHWGDEVPESLGQRIVLDCAKLKPRQLEAEVGELTRAIHVRGSLYQRICQLGSEKLPEIARRVAQDIADEPDRTAVAEFLELFEATYTQDMDPAARYRVALAVGQTGAPKAKRILRAWYRSETHPLPKEGIREALQRLGSGPG